MTKATHPNSDPSIKTDGGTSKTVLLAITSGCVAVIVAALTGFGQPMWCDCGSPSLVSWNVWSSHNSQHAIDPYSISHVSHGLLFFAGLLLATKWLSATARFAIAAFIETGWEIIENTPLIINRYREATISLDYFGDSITNSCFDLLACLVGYLLANRFGWRFALVLFVVSEIIMLAWIRDSLILNVIMLTVPIDSIRDWQSAGAVSS